MDKIIIVESPSKSKTIESYMGKDYKVLSSKGHVRDLSTKGVGGLGIDVNNGFRPDYVNIKDKEVLIKDLVKECKGKEVYLATDPDREGEAISWHLAKILGLDLDEDNRVVFNEITKPAILEAFKHPRKIDKNLVSSQEARRMLDRIIGFKLSALLQKKIKSPSAGRVQSVALKLIVDLEKEIQAFIPEEYWEINAKFKDFEAMLVRYNDEKVEMKNEADAQKMMNLLGSEYIVGEIEKKPLSREPKPAYITSTLQQDASTKLGMQSSRTMKIAQSLYEGKKVSDEIIGLITYMRTDSDRLSDLFVSDANKYILDNYGEKYVGHVHHKEVLQSQDAHEAIRPTSVFRTPESMKNYLKKDEYEVYELIYNRAVASLMAPALFETQRLELNNNNLIFKANGNRLIFDGFLSVYRDKEENKENLLPALNKDDILNALECMPTQHFTKAPARYTEARLIKNMEELGIGRPSTYAQTVDTLKIRKYVEAEDKRFVPTEQGMITVEKLDEFFDKIINVEYTAKMETVLDEIAQGNRKWNDLISQFYHAFIPMVDSASKQMSVLPPKETGNVCPLCGSKMVIRKGKYGEFEACSNYPKCKYIKKDETKEEVKRLDIICPKCGVGHFVEKIASKGRNKGKAFYACDNFPKCRNAVSGIPTKDLCPVCGNVLIETPKGIKCGTLGCEYNKKEE